MPQRIGDAAATPRLGRQPGAKTLLGLAQLDVQRVAAQLLEHVQRGRALRVHHVVRDDRPQTGEGAIEPHAPGRIGRDEPIDGQPGALFLLLLRRLRLAAEEALEERLAAVAGLLGKVDVDEHHPLGVEHDRAVAVPRDHGQQPAVGAFDLVQDLFPQRHAAVFVAVQPLAAEEGVEDPPRGGQGRLMGDGLARIGRPPAGKPHRPAPRRRRFRGGSGPKFRNLHRLAQVRQLVALAA